MKEQKWSGFKNMKLIIAIPVAIFSGLISLYFASILIPTSLEVASMIDGGMSIGFGVFFLIVTMIFGGLFTWFFSLVFLLAQKRIIEILY